MPWKECSVIDERGRFVARLLEGEKMAALSGFGEENWVGTIVWKGTTSNNPTNIAQQAKSPLLSSGCLHEQLYWRRNHKQQDHLWFPGGFQKFDISLPQICADETILMQIVQSLQADLCNPGQVTRHRGQVLRQVRSCQQGLQLGIVVPPLHQPLPSLLPLLWICFS